MPKIKKDPIDAIRVYLPKNGGISFSRSEGAAVRRRADSLPRPRVFCPGYAANNDMWVSANNTSRRESSWPSFFVHPDGFITGRLPLNRAGVLISKLDTRPKRYDASRPWRGRALRGIYHSGTLIEDPRSRSVRSL